LDLRAPGTAVSREAAGAALQADDCTGRAKAVVDEDSRTLIGVTIVGPAVVDHLHAAAETAQVSGFALASRPRSGSCSVDCPSAEPA
jgi:pyruvate/2-oxoglutarate dehydrogenase complex dihydrolipoamide dehydrogenase (E3) component